MIVGLAVYSIAPVHLHTGGSYLFELKVNVLKCSSPKIPGGFLPFIWVHFAGDLNYL